MVVVEFRRKPVAMREDGGAPFVVQADAGIGVEFRHTLAAAEEIEVNFLIGEGFLVVHADLTGNRLVAIDDGACTF